MQSEMASAYESLLVCLKRECEAFYGQRLISLVLFGSVARGTMRADSDLDFLVVAEPLPFGRMARVAEFKAVEEAMANPLETTAKTGIHAELSPLFKTPAEVLRGSALFLDFVEDARLLFDRANFMAHYLEGLRLRLSRLGANRVWRGSRWYWDLKPGFRPGDVFEL